MSRFSEDFYIFAAHKSDPDANSHIMVMEGSFAGVVFVINWIKLRKKYFGIFGPYELKYHYSVVNEESVLKKNDPKLHFLVGQIIEDVWEKYY